MTGLSNPSTAAYLSRTAKRTRPAQLLASGGIVPSRCAHDRPRGARNVEGADGERLHHFETLVSRLLHRHGRRSDAFHVQLPRALWYLRVGSEVLASDLHLGTRQLLDLQQRFLVRHLLPGDL